MKVRIVRIGNSQGIRIPKAILRQCRFGETVELQVEDNRLVLRPASHPRAGWEEAFARAAKAGPEDLHEWRSMSFSRSDRKEWKW